MGPWAGRRPRALREGVPPGGRDAPLRPRAPRVRCPGCAPRRSPPSSRAPSRGEGTPLVAQHQFVAILRAQGWRAPLIGTWTKAGHGEGVAPDGTRLRWEPPAGSDDVNEKGTWSSVWVPALGHADAVMAAEVAGLGDDPLRMPLGPQGRHRLERLPALLAELGIGAVIEPPWLRAGAVRLHLASGAIEHPDGRLEPRDATLAPLAGIDDPGLGRLLAEARRRTA